MRYHITRESFIPRGSKPLADTGSDAVAYAYNQAGRFYAAMFYGKQAKPLWHWSFRNEEARAARIAEAFKNRRSHTAYKATVRADRKTPHAHQVGDVFATHWGYDQTNVEHYEITELHGATMATIRRIAAHNVETGWMQGKCSPDFGNFIGEPFRVRLTQHGFSVDGHGAHKVKVHTVGGVKVGEASNWTSYA
jgi:hypothetical protein